MDAALQRVPLITTFPWYNDVPSLDAKRRISIKVNKGRVAIWLLLSAVTLVHASATNGRLSLSPPPLTPFLLSSPGSPPVPSSPSTLFYCVTWLWHTHFTPPSVYLFLSLCLFPPSPFLSPPSFLLPHPGFKGE